MVVELKTFAATKPPIFDKFFRLVEADRYFRVQGIRQIAGQPREFLVQFEGTRCTFV